MKRKALTQSGGIKRTPKKTRPQLSQRDAQLMLAKSILNDKEVKTHSISSATTAVTLAVPVMFQITDPTVLIPGVGQVNQYVGSKIQPIGLTIRYKLTAGDTTNFMRVGVFQCSGTTTTSIGNFYETTTATDTQIKAYPAFAFNTLSDSHHSMVLGSDSNVIAGKIYIKGKRLLPLQFISGGSVITSGQIVMCVLSDSTILPNPTIHVYSSLKYTDV